MSLITCRVRARGPRLAGKANRKAWSGLLGGGKEEQAARKCL